jgi:hypothetical protein
MLQKGERGGEGALSLIESKGKIFKTLRSKQLCVSFPFLASGKFFKFKHKMNFRA